MTVLLIVLAIAVVVSWIMAIRALNQQSEGSRATNFMIVASVLTTLFLMFLFLQSQG
ncbi:hypothetical protein [Staphylococcus sp. 17KM0847]|uniref:hypothetical protein n=1 Tax=Staphylococcus sp. 17KM0847 TaxID=2583989 RepID=UPI0015E0046F|nr:hypothetical protein [Staphylococcus sp. 17KM0847]